MNTKATTSIEAMIKSLNLWALDLDKGLTISIPGGSLRRIADKLESLHKVSEQAQPVDDTKIDTQQKFFELVRDAFHAGIKQDFVRFDNCEKKVMLLASAVTPPQRKPLELDAYDAGLFASAGGKDVDWWWDYIRAELGRAHDFYQAQADQNITGENT